MTANTKPHWEHYPHGADIGIRGYGDSITTAFEQAALALTAVIVDPKEVQPKKSVSVKCENADYELLFADWINSIILEMALNTMLFSEFKVEVNDSSLTAEIKGEKVDRARHQPTVEIKGATFTTLKVAQNSAGEWLAQTVVDV